MRIGVDIDGVINNWCEIATDCINEMYGKKYDDNQYDLYVGLSRQQINDFYKRYGKTALYHDTRLRPFAKESLEMLRDAGHEIYLMTARPCKVAQETAKWLEEHGIKYDNLFFDCGHKSMACKAQGIAVMVDDSPYNIAALVRDGVPAVCFAHGYNKKSTGYLYRSNDWRKITYYLLHMAR